MENNKNGTVAQVAGTLNGIDPERSKQTEVSGIQKPYAYHKPSDEGLCKITKLRKAFSELDTLIKELAPNSREKSHCITMLETTAMWAIKAIVINDDKATPEI